MSSSDDKRLFGAQIDKDMHELISARLDYGEKSKMIRSLANSIAYGESWGERTPHDIRLQHIEEKLADARSRRRSVNAEIEDLEDERDRVQELRENQRTREELLDASLISLEAELRSGNNIFRDHGGVESVAREYDLEAQAVLDKLMERNPDVPDHAFQDARSTRESWDGVPAEERNTPVENREGLYR